MVAVFFSCNIFSPQEVDQDKWYMVGDAWVLEGKKKMWEEDWIGAAKDFAKAIETDSKLSEAYFYLGKCILRLNRVNLEQVWDDIKPESDELEKNEIPFLYKLPSDKDSIKQPIPRFTTKLYRIVLYDTLINNVTNDTTLDFNIRVYEEEFSADTTIDSVFLERKRIYDAVSQSIQWLEIINCDKSLDNKIKRAQYESDYLVEISIISVLGIIDLNNNGVFDWDLEKNERNAYRILCQDMTNLDDMEFDSLKNISKNPYDIKKNLDLILISLDSANSSYKNFTMDLVNGDMDSSMVNPLGKMIGNFKKMLPYFYYDDFVDNDEDEYNTNENAKRERMIWIDWDYDEKIDVYGPSDTADSGHLHIGDSLHKALHPEMYEWVDPNDPDFFRYRYTGGYTYEFIAGDWGVDEEILDGEDNDGDGLVDEDSRNSADTLDDDGDYYDTDSSQVLNPESLDPMYWDSISTDEFIDIPKDGNWSSVPIKPLYKSLHDTIYPTLYNKSIPDSLPIYTGGYLGDFSDGDYGLDEEYYDGIDNDKDGLIDEDVGEQLPPAAKRDELINLLRSLGLRGEL